MLSLMLWLYRILFPPLLLLALPYYLLRMKRRGGYRRHFSHRLGLIGALPDKRPGVRRIWLQAVSVGEMLAIGPILDAFKKDPSVEVVLTTTTSTGYRLARERYHEMVAGIGYFPVDWWWFSLTAWRRIRPDMIILTEGERWPEHLHQAARRSVPALCINARLSDRSYRRMHKWKGMALPLMKGITKLLACSENDAVRFREIGFSADKVVVTGNIKLDVTIAPLSAEDKASLRAELGLGDAPILLGSSTWPGEEEALVQALKALQTAGVAARLLIVPRHAERRSDVEAVLRSSGLTYHLRTRGSAPQPVDVAVADTTGELRKLTQLGEIVFVGKSLPPHDQGQTPVEAAALGKPILFGPGMTNFREISRYLIGHGGARVVKDQDELAKVILQLMADQAARQKMSAGALEWHRTNQGAVARTLAAIQAEFGS